MGNTYNDNNIIIMFNHNKISRALGPDSDALLFQLYNTSVVFKVLSLSN